MRVQVISRGAGRSIVSAAAYRHRTKMMDEQIGKEFRYHGGRAEMVHEELALPDATPSWLRAAIDGRTVASASKVLWNAVDRYETRCDAQLAREIILALPVELGREQNIELVRDFVRENLTSRGMVADWVYHDKDGNPHIHIMATLRALAEEGFGPKKVAIIGEDGQPVRVRTPERPEGKIVYRLWAGDKEVLKKWKVAWAETASRHLALAGHDFHLDGRSYDEQGLRGLEQRHFGPNRAALVRKGFETHFSPAALAKRYEIADRITDDPALLLKQLANERSTFNEWDIARAIHRYIDDPIVFANVRARLMSSDDLVLLQPQRLNGETSKVEQPAVFTTRGLVKTEYEMARLATTLSKMTGFGVSSTSVDAAVASPESAAAGVRLDAEQIEAVRHITADGAIAAVVGVAGAGKSTLLSAARTVWETEGRCVVGAALAGKAAEGLEESSGIRARTIASWEHSWQRGNDLLEKGDVLIVDEAGMVSSQQMARLLKHIEEAGAKAVLVGDPMQLQPIQAGAAFRAIVERISSVELAGVRRQSEEWARAASMQFARGGVKEALTAYGDRGHIVSAETRQAAIERIVVDWTTAHRELVAKAAAEGRQLRGNELAVLAHTNDDVKVLNRSIREVLSTDGLLSDGRPFLTERGMREFAVGDRIIFLENARFVEPHAANLGVQHVKNGMLGTVRPTAAGRESATLTVRLDSGRDVIFAESAYRNVDYGYAATIHKSQGSTFDRAFVLATGMMDQHLTYVAMTRHRCRADLYAASEDFQRRQGCERQSRADYTYGVTGELVETGVAKFRAREGVGPSPYADLRLEDGETHRLWGVSLPKALEDGGVKVGDAVRLRRDGTEKVTIKVAVIGEEPARTRVEKRVVERNVWTAGLIERAGDRQRRIARENRLPALFPELVERLSRSGGKTTTLDYVTEDAYRSLAEDFAQRRGIEAISRSDLVKTAISALSWVSDQRRRVVRLWQRANVAIELAPDHSERIRSRCGAAERQPFEIEADGDRELLSATISFSRPLVEDARLANLASPAWAEREAIIMPLLKRIYRDPAVALARLNAQTSNAVGDPQLIADGLIRSPKELGNVRGGQNLVDGQAARKERVAAQSVLSELALLARAHAAEFRRQEARFLNGERMRRACMGFAIPPLSKNARARLLEVEAAGERGAYEAYRSAFRIATEDRSIVHEVKAIDEALTRRFGWLAFSDKADDFAKRNTTMRMPENMSEERRAELTVLFEVVRRFAAELRIVEKREPGQLIVPAASAPQSPVARLPMLPAVTEFKNCVEDEARLRAVRAEHYRQEKAIFGRDAVRIWRDPSAAVTTIEGILTMKVDPERIVRAVVTDPAAYGTLRGSSRMLDGFLAAGRERRVALQAVKTAAASIRAMGRSYAAAYEAELLAVSTERTRLSVAIPGLTKEAERELRRLTKHTAKNATHLARRVRALSPEIRAEFQAVSKALNARFGPGALAHSERGASKLVPKSQRAAFHAMRHRLHSLQRATSAYQAEEASVVRQRRAIEHRAPAIG